jgi:outer membrane protein assembly factor BamB
LLKLSRDGESIKADLVYRNKLMKNHHSGVILVTGMVFGSSDPNGWICQDFETGKAIWDERFTFDKGSIAYAEDHFYCYGESKGEVALIEASAKGWIEKGRFMIPEQTKIPRKQGKIWTPPVIANGRLYLRDNDLIFCYDIKRS